MKNFTLVFAGLFIVCGAKAQQTQAKVITYPNGVSVSTAEAFEISRPLKDLAAENPSPEVDMIDRKEVERRPPVQMTPNPNALPLDGIDPIVQSYMGGEKALTPPILNFNGQSGTGYPNDPTGAASLTDYVQAVNTSYRAFNKTTGAPIMAPLNLATLWPGSTNDGDPIVLYDKYADRWLIEQFQQTGNKILIAISTTNSPTGTFYKYTFVPNASTFPDYPKLAIWQDGYYLCNNWQSAPQQVTVLNRTQMLAGNPTPQMLVKTLPGGPHIGFYCPLPADADGVLPPGGTPENIFAIEDDNWGSGFHDRIHIWKMSVDWVTPSNTTLIEDAADNSPLSPAPFNTVWPHYANEISQQGTTQQLDAIEGVLMYRAQYRRWWSHNSVVLSHAVNINTSTGQSGVRWYELWQDPSTFKWTIHQQGTFAPDGENRWMSSIAEDGGCNIAMAYAVSGANEYPSIRYTGRYATDPLGLMTLNEITAVAGTGAETGINRYGDYSHTSIDPSDDMTFWHTGEWEANSGNMSRIFSWKITPSTVAGIVENTVKTPEFSALQSSNMLNVKGNYLGSDEAIAVDLFDIEGRQISTKMITPAANSFETSIDVTGLPKAAYFVRIANNSFQKIFKLIVN
jgi:hypothetical protein